MTAAPEPAVWVTGVGMVTPLGVGREAGWEGFSSGRSAIGPIRAYDTSGWPVRIAAEVPDGFEAAFAERFPPALARRCGRFTQFALLAGAEALEQSGLDLAREDRQRIGVAMGVGAGPVHYMSPLAEAMRSRDGLTIDDVQDHNYVVRTMLNGPAAMLSIHHALEGPSTTIAAACASGAGAIATAMLWLSSGLADVALAGGADASVSEHAMRPYHKIGAISPDNELGPRASRPFHRTRNGFVMAEGAAALVLESEAHARSRGARPLARILGSAMTSEASSLVAPRRDGSGMLRTMTAALDQARARPAEISAVIAHAPSTPAGDAAEALALTSLLGDRTPDVPVTAPKSMFGHAMGASSAIQAALAVLSLQHDTVLPTINLDDPDPDIRLHVPAESQERTLGTILCNAFGFGGHNVSLVLGK